MASIDGFRYEPYEHSSCIARRDFRNTHSDYENSRGSRSKRKSPKKKSYACQATQDKHVYVTVKYVNTSDNKDLGCFWMHDDCIHVYCLECGSIKRHIKASNFYGDIDEVIDVAGSRAYTGFPYSLPRL